MQIGDMAGGVAGHVEDFEVKAQQLRRSPATSGSKGSGIRSLAGP